MKVVMTGCQSLEVRCLHSGSSLLTWAPASGAQGGGATARVAGCPFSVPTHPRPGYPWSVLPPEPLVRPSSGTPVLPPVRGVDGDEERIG